jgi:hypothetical protein
VSIEELIESERAGIAAWRSIKGRHPGDAITLGYCVDGLAEAAERLGTLQELRHYTTKDEPNATTNGGHE